MSDFPQKPGADAFPQMSRRRILAYVSWYDERSRSHSLRHLPDPAEDRLRVRPSFKEHIKACAQMQRGQCRPLVRQATARRERSMATQAELVTVVQTESERLQQYLAALPQDAWTTPSACALWEIRDVVAHMS